MVVKINGKSEDVQGATVLDLLKAKNIDPHMVAVELNSTMLERDQLGAAAVKEGDSLEFLFYMGGGCPLGPARDWVGEVAPRGGRVELEQRASRGQRGGLGQLRAGWVKSFPWGGRVQSRERGRLGALGVSEK
jgi:sulfur carrier protein